jgi:hypothetical protein
MNTSPHSTPRELDFRTGDGLETRLLWNPGDGSLTVTVDDIRTDERFVIGVAAENALAVFRHPFAYAI